MFFEVFSQRKWGSANNNLTCKQTKPTIKALKLFLKRFLYSLYCWLSKGIFSKQSSNDGISVRVLCLHYFLMISLSIIDWYYYHIETSKLICKAYQLTYFYMMRIMIIQQFLAYASILYPYKTAENLRFFWCFQKVSTWKIGQKSVNGLKTYCFLTSHFAHVICYLIRKMFLLEN